MCIAPCETCHSRLLLEDDSYVEHEEDREEFVVCDKGILWRGNNRQPLATPWEYGQVRAEQCTMFTSFIDTLG